MSDTDSLDGLIDDIDMDTLLNSKEDVSSSASVINNNDNQKKGEEDLDDLLDDFFDDKDTSTTSPKTDKTPAKEDDIEDDGGLTAHLQAQKMHDLERALHTLPNANMKEKWLNNLKEDIKWDEPVSPFKRSYSYLEWQDPVEHYAVDKSLRNLILRACSKSNMSDAQAKRLQDVLFDDPVLLKKYCRQIVKEKSPDVMKDADFSEEKYSSLRKAIL